MEVAPVPGQAHRLQPLLYALGHRAHLARVVVAAQKMLPEEQEEEEEGVNDGWLARGGDGKYFKIAQMSAAIKRSAPSASDRL